jgi:NCAIR mutase (PurE)-related protein
LGLAHFTGRGAACRPPKWAFVLDSNIFRSVLDAVRAGAMSVDEALAYVGHGREDETLPFATLDHLRAVRTGFPEVVYCPGKTPEQIAAILERLAARSPAVMATRASEQEFTFVRRTVSDARFDADARIITVEREPLPRVGLAVVLSAGTADRPVAAEAAVALEVMGNAVARVDDVGIAGIHRVLGHIGALRTANVIVVVAGMDGALPAVVAGLTDRPVVAVPTSVGYGSSFGGLAALLAMLNACAGGVSVVNIDGGFSAACAASRINHIAEKAFVAP